MKIIAFILERQEIIRILNQQSCEVPCKGG